MQTIRPWTLVKWTWLAAVLAALAWFVGNRWAEALAYLVHLGAAPLVCSLAAIALAKVLLAEISRRAASRAGIALSWSDAFHIYNITQLGKYIPGAVWHVVARAVMLRRAAASPRSIRDAMLVEFLWVIGAATCLAIPAALLFFSETVSEQTDLVGWLVPTILWVGLLILCVAAAFIWYRSGKEQLRLDRLWRRMIPAPIDILTLLGTWALLGFSFFLVCRPVAGDSLSLGSAIGLYALAYVGGALAPFAPAGLGVREGLVVWLFSAFPVDPALVLVACLVHRVLYIVVEVALVIGFNRRSDIFESKTPDR